MKILKSKERKNSVMAGIIGLCVGDALGVPFEFKERRDMILSPAKNMVGFGSHFQPIGTWSDDSSLTFCLMDSLCNGFNIEDIGTHFIRWHNAEEWTPHGRVFDIGITTRYSIRKLTNGTSPEFSGLEDENSNGNGSLMRILPMAYYLAKYKGNKFELIERVSAITHGHIRSKIACSIYVELALNLMKGLSKKTAYKNMQDTILNYYTDKVSIEELSNFNRILKDKIYRFHKNQISSSGYVIDTLEASIWCFMRNKNYKNAVINAINLGHDTDTTGAVTGGLAGIYFGYKNIPEKWIDVIVKKELIVELCNRFEDSLK